LVGHILELVRNGGVFAYAAIFAGLIGTALGLSAVIALTAKSKAASTTGVIAVLLAVCAAGLGMLGTMLNKSKVDSALASVTRVMAERIHQLGYREAQETALVGFVAALLPFVLGAIAIFGARAVMRAQAASVVASLIAPGEPPPSNALGLISMGWVAIAALAIAGAWVMAHAPISRGSYDLDPDDSDGWELAGAADEVKSDARACRRLDDVLRRLGTRTVPIQWHPAAAYCVELWVHGGGSGPKGEPVAMLMDEAMLASPLVFDAEQRAKVLLRIRTQVDSSPDPGPEPEDPPPDGVEPVAPPMKVRPTPVPVKAAAEGSLDPHAVAPVVRASLPAFRGCYERELQVHPELTGKLVIKFSIAADGRVSAAEETSSPPFPSPVTRDCMIARFKTLHFPAHEGGPISVSYPFVFSGSK
jgi:hypothetical protein